MCCGLWLAAIPLMTEPSDGRKRILALHQRALNFSTRINQSYPAGTVNYPSRVVWDQLVRASDGASNNLIEADAASSRKDFLNKMRIALREAKESRACLSKIRMGPLANAERVQSMGLEREADELAAIFATIVKNAAMSTPRQ
jgi:four helix bundle protein